MLVERESLEQLRVEANLRIVCSGEGHAGQGNAVWYFTQERAHVSAGKYEQLMVLLSDLVCA